MARPCITGPAVPACSTVATVTELNVRHFFVAHLGLGRLLQLARMSDIQFTVSCVGMTPV